MKSLIIHMRELAKNRTLALLTAVILPILSPLAFADGSAWSLDPTTSSARFFQGSTANPDSVNSGVARVTGKVRLDTNDLDKSLFDNAGETPNFAMSIERRLSDCCWSRVMIIVDAKEMSVFPASLTDSAGPDGREEGQTFQI